jgi:Ca2+-binding RTX toxin-like protein
MAVMTPFVRRSTRLAAALALTVLAIGPVAPAHAAPLCAYDTFARTLTVTAQLTLVNISRNTSYLTVNDVSCALLYEVDKVNIDLAGLANTVVIFDLANGPLGPGYTLESNGQEIEFDVTNLSTGHAFNVLGSAGDDAVTVGTKVNAFTGLTEQQINLNALDEGTSPDVDVVIHGAPGQMKLIGNGGADQLTGGGTGTIGSRGYFHPMTLDGGPYPDTLLGGLSDDLLLIDISQTDRRDTYNGGPGTDTVLFTARAGFTYTPYISLDDKRDDGVLCPMNLRCEADNYGSDIERLLGSSADERMVGNDGVQTLNGGSGNDTLNGLGGADTLIGSAGIDTVAGGGGGDSIDGGVGADTMDGGAGIDTVTYARATAPVSVSLNGTADDGMAGEGDDVASTIENAIGSKYGDTFVGNAFANLFDGKDGNDQLSGADGDDLLYGRAGDDAFNGGLGTDLCSQGTGTGSKVGCEA